MPDKYKQMIATERLILSPQRRLKYFEPVIAFAVIAVAIIGVGLYGLTKSPDALSGILLSISGMLLLAGYVYRHQTSGLRLKSIPTAFDRSSNRELARSAVDELGWITRRENRDYLEAIVPSRTGIGRYAQLVVLLFDTRKILITSISQPDISPVQGGWSFGKHKKNIKQFREMLAILSEEYTGAEATTNFGSVQDTT